MVSLAEIWRIIVIVFNDNVSKYSSSKMILFLVHLDLAHNLPAGHYFLLEFMNRVMGIN